MATIESEFQALRTIVLRLQERIMTTQTQLATQLLAVRDQVVKARGEITQKIATLEAAVLAGQTVSAEVEAALTAVRGAVQAIDDIVPN